MFPVSYNLRRITALVGTLMALGACPAQAASVAAPYEVADWEGFREAAVSYTFDDSCSNQFAIAVPMFNEAGFKMTLFSCTNALFAGWDKLSAAQADGHEVASHTVNHLRLNQLSASEAISELADSQAAIVANVPGAQALTFAYPYCVSPSDPSVTGQYYIASRTCSGQIVAKSPTDFQQISSLICGTQGSIKTVADFQSRSSSALASNGWAVYLIHGIDNDGGYSPLESTVLQGSIDFYKENADLFWVDTFSNVARYIRERDDATVTELSSSADSLVVSLTDTLDNAIYNVPVTLRRTLPEGWTSAAVSQAGAPVTSEIVTVGETTYVQFNAVPDAGNVTIAPVAEPAKWLGIWTIDEAGWANAEGWIGWVYPFESDVVWSATLGWIYVPEALFSSHGGWAYTLR